jgi:hypothetical protein
MGKAAAKATDDVSDQPFSLRYSVVGVALVFWNLEGRV